MSDPELVPLPDDAREVWAGMGVHAPDQGNRGRKHRLVTEVKRLIDRVALLDINGADGAAGLDRQLEGLIKGTAALADTAASLPSLDKNGGMAMSGSDDAVLAERSGFSGHSNPLAPPMTIVVDGEVTKASATWTAAYEGPPGCLHGGYVAAAFDDLLGVAQMASGQAGFTGTLTVRMVAPTPLFEQIDYEAGVDRIEGRKIWCWGTAKVGDRLLAEATCLFIQPKVGLVQHIPLLREAAEAGRADQTVQAYSDEDPPPAP
jgi:acyl-coenzyme A thioesterase PaaI-like protein